MVYPAYTKAANPGPVSAGPVEAIEQTRASLVLTSDRPVVAGLLEVIEEMTGEDGSVKSIHIGSFSPLARIAAKQGEKQLENKLALTQPWRFLPEFITQDPKKQQFKYQLTVVSADEQMGHSPRHTMKVVPDQVPHVEIQTISGVALAKNQTEIDVQANAIVAIGGFAQDDVAVKEIKLKIRHADGRPIYVVGQQQPVMRGVQRAIGVAPPPATFLFPLDLKNLSFESDPAKARPTMFKVGAVLEDSEF